MLDIYYRIKTQKYCNRDSVQRYFQPLKALNLLSLEFRVDIHSQF